MKTFRKKGLDFEKEVSKKLSKWIDSSGKIIFWRTFGSGSASYLGKNFEGDIINIEPEGEEFGKLFYIECKRYKDFDITSFFDLKTSNEIKLIREYLQKSKKLNKYLFFVIKRNFSKKSLLFIQLPPDRSIQEVYIILDKCKIAVTTLEDFIQKYTLEDILSLWR